jgi:hypothetical protein
MLKYNNTWYFKSLPYRHFLKKRKGKKERRKRLNQGKALGSEAEMNNKKFPC